jgi:hypothetical protein
MSCPYGDACSNFSCRHTHKFRLSRAGLKMCKNGKGGENCSYFMCEHKHDNGDLRKGLQRWFAKLFPLNN